MARVACVAGVRKGKGRELLRARDHARGKREEGNNPSSFPFSPHIKVNEKESRYCWPALLLPQMPLFSFIYNFSLTATLLLFSGGFSVWTKQIQ